MPDTPQPEVLQHGTGDPWPWRRITTLLLVGAVAVGAVVGLDGWARQREEAALAGCVAAADAAVDRAWEPIVAMAGYVRPTLAQVPDGSTRSGIFDLVAGEAQGGEQLVAAAGKGCADVAVWWHHRDLRRQQDACASALAAEADRLAAVARDGRAAFERTSLERCG